MLVPDPIVEIAFTTLPGDAPVWEDVSEDVRRVSTQRGRQQELQRFRAGRATIILDNLDRRYDPEHAASPHAGNIKPGRRLRVRADWAGAINPIFDGYIDRWEQTWEKRGDAAAVVTATDGFKILQRTKLPPSPYFVEVDADDPDLWWRLGEPEGDSATVFDSSGNGNDGTPAGGVTFAAQGLIDRDPDTAMTSTVAGNTGVTGSFALSEADPFAIELWFRLDELEFFDQTFFSMHANNGFASNYVEFSINPTTNEGTVVFSNGAGSFFQVQNIGPFETDRTYHFVLTHDSDRILRVYLDGGLAVTGATTTGTFATTTAVLGSAGVGGAPGGTLDEFAVYTEPGGSTALSSARIGVHNSAGRTPWNGDTPRVRMERVLDITPGLLPTLRDLDPGESILQGTTLGMTALEHLQKAAESDFGDLFMAADGDVRFVGRAALTTPVPEATFGDDVLAEIGYREAKIDHGDEFIRNPVTVSRLEGTAQTAQDAVLEREFGDNHFTLDGLYHNSDALSATAAAFFLAEYGQPRTRVRSLTLGPPVEGEEAALYPQMLGRELLEVVTVRRRPQGVGDPIEQDARIEGIRHEYTPRDGWVTTWTLSPAYEGAF